MFRRFLLFCYSKSDICTIAGIYWLH